MDLTGFNNFVSLKSFLFNYIIIKIDDHNKAIEWNIKRMIMMVCIKRMLANKKKKNAHAFPIGFFLIKILIMNKKK
jgi:hypothetical protein